MARTWALLLGVKEGGGGVHGCRSSVWFWDNLGPFLTSSALHAWERDQVVSGKQAGWRCGRGRWCSCLWDCPLGPGPQQ